LNVYSNISSEAILRIISQDGKEVLSKVLIPKNEHVILRLPETSGLFNVIIISREGTGHRRILKL
jgi:hypothetical protein